MDEIFKSAYKVFHLTETALVKIQSNVLRAVDNNDSIVLLLIDQSAAFDRVDLSILLSRLAVKLLFALNGILRIASSLSRSRIPSHQYIRQFMHGVPQGSVLRPLLYVLYTAVTNR